MSNFDLLDALTPLPPQELPRQWRIARVPDERFEGWTHLKSGTWHLQAHPNAAVSTVLDRDGSPVGWIVGAIREGMTRVGESTQLDIGHDCQSAELERALYDRGPDGRAGGAGLQGPWTAIISGTRQRVYVAAAHSVLYAADEQCVATSPSLFSSLIRNRELCGAINPQVTKAFYGFGLTPYRGIERLLPNHVLDLETFRPSRHWPLGDLAPYDSEADSADRLISGMKPLLEDIGVWFENVEISLSAGRDSRAVLALCRALVEKSPGKVSAFTTRGDDVWSRIDAAAAAILAERAGITHKIRSRGPSKAASEHEVARAFVRMGEAKWGPILISAASSAPRTASAPGTNGGPKGIHLPGMAGETARSYYWRGVIPGPSDIEPVELARRVGMPAIPQVAAAAAEWVRRLPDAVRSRPHDVLDLLYVEQRLGCWDAPARYLFRGGGATLSLMSSALGLDTMLRLEPEVRLRGSFQQSVVERAWPSLANLPYNQPSGRQRLTAMTMDGRDFMLRIARRLRAEAISVLAKRD